MILTVTLNAAIDKRYVVEGYQVGEVNRVKECAYTPGGKGLNVSKPASIAGAEVVATGFVGGHAGNYIEDALKPFGIKSEFYHLEEESRSCINIWDEVNHVQTEFLEPGFTVSEEEFEGFEKHFTELVKKADVVAMSGSVPKGLDGTAYQRLVRICKEAGKPLQEILDNEGLDFFLHLEGKIGAELDYDKTVIATGGSMVLSENAMENLRKNGKVVFIDVDLDEIKRRVTNIKTRGIAFGKGETLDDVYRVRYPLYKKYADITVSMELSSIETTVDAIVEKLKLEKQN